jgi:hypothetical protein
MEIPIAAIIRTVSRRRAPFVRQPSQAAVLGVSRKRPGGDDRSPRAAAGAMAIIATNAAMV